MKLVVLYSSETQAGILRAFEQLGHEVVPLFYGFQFGRVTTHLFYSSPGRIWKKIRANFNAQIRKLPGLLIRGDVDFVLILKGHGLDCESKDILNEVSIPKLQWTTDSVGRFPGQMEVARFMDKVFVQDGADEKVVANSQWLPLGFDRDMFSYSSRKDIDLLMVGNLQLPYYSTRREYVAECSKLVKRGCRVVFVGTNVGDSLGRQLSENGVQVLSSQPLNLYANFIRRARVCLNVHQDDGTMAINPLFFAIPATGGLQATERRTYFGRWLTEGVDYFPANKLEIVDVVHDLIKTRTLLQLDISRTVTEEHSYAARAKTLLRSVEEVRERL